MPSPKEITEKVCFESGHRIVSLAVKDFIDPVSKGLCHNYVVLCERCGLDLESIRKYRGLIRRNRPTTREERKNKNVSES